MWARSFRAGVISQPRGDLAEIVPAIIYDIYCMIQRVGRNMAIQRQCLSDIVKFSLIESIVSGKLPPGIHLVEAKLAQEFETSQTPIREALRELEAMNLVEALPHKGVKVRAVSDQEMAEAYSLRGLLEEYAAHSAAGNLKGNTQSLTKLVKAIHKAAKNDDHPGYAQSDIAFHRSIVISADNKTLLTLWDSLAFEHKTRLTITRCAERLISIAGDHDPIVEAFERGDGLLAGRLLREHCEEFIPRGSKS
jgi:DNA-binding GntR family transcriptional regulator